MSESPAGLVYPLWIAEALRLVARRALEEVAAHGLPPGHHFVVAMRTDAPRVGLPGFLRQQYPHEVTLVLENQFWDLVVDDEGFSVTLAFSGARHRLFAPWEALTAFADPAAELALRFVVPVGDLEAPSAPDEAVETAPQRAGRATTPAALPADRETTHGDSSGEVVHFDRFRRRREEDP